MDEVINFLYSLRNYYIYITFIVGFPSFLLYLSEVVVIIKHKQLHNSFNILFAVRAIANFLKMWGSVFGYRLPKICGGFILPFYQILPGRILAIYPFLLFFCFYADNLSTAAIQLNRFIAIAFPIHYEKAKTLPNIYHSMHFDETYRLGIGFEGLEQTTKPLKSIITLFGIFNLYLAFPIIYLWHFKYYPYKIIWRYLLPVSILIIYGMPFPLPFCFISPDVQLSIVSADPLSENRTSFSLKGYYGNQCSLDNSYLVRLLSISCLIVCTLLGLSTVFLYHWRKRHDGGTLNNISNVSDRIERNLLIYAMCTFVGLGIITIFFHSYNLPLGGNFPDLRLSLDPITHDLTNIVLPSWLMLWANSILRQQWMADILPKRWWNLWKNETKIKTVNIMCRPLPTQQTNGNRREELFTLNRINVA